MKDSISESSRRGKRSELAPAPFEVRRMDHPLGVVLFLGGELDLAAVALLQKQLDRVPRGQRAVVIDLSGLRFMDSSGLRTLVQAQRKLRDSGGQLFLVCGSRAVRRMFELTGSDHYFAWCDSPTAALRIVRERRAGGRAGSAPRQTATELEGELGGAA